MSIGRDEPRVMVVVGTRPDALKLAPVIRVLRGHSSPVRPFVVATAQHREMMDQVLTRFSVVPDIDLDLMRSNQGLAGLTSRVLGALEPVLREVAPSLLMVQGDTVTAFAAGLAAFYAGIPVAHVEAGLRTRDLTQPFPEEAARHLLSVITHLHLAPTPSARRNLVKESVPAETIVVTGNTVVDALLDSCRLPIELAETPLADIPLSEGRILLVTSHRRESWGRVLENMCHALVDLVERFDDIRIVYPVHLSPNVRGTVESVLSKRERIHLLPPLDYPTFIHLMKRSHIILTDSGGIQEEAATFHKPLLCLRMTTERPEAFDLGMGKVIGTDRRVIVEETARLLTDPGAYHRMTVGDNPYGDGRAAERILEVLARWLKGERPWLEPGREFVPPQPVSREASPWSLVSRW